MKLGLLAFVTVDEVEAKGRLLTTTGSLFCAFRTGLCTVCEVEVDDDDCGNIANAKIIRSSSSADFSMKLLEGGCVFTGDSTGLGERDFDLYLVDGGSIGCFLSPAEEEGVVENSRSTAVWLLGFVEEEEVGGTEEPVLVFT